MNKQIYNSSNENGLLHSEGTYNSRSADKSIVGFKLPIKLNISTINTFGKTIVYGATKLIDPEPKHEHQKV